MKNFIILLGFLSFGTSTNAQIDPQLASELQALLDSRVYTGYDNGISAHLIMPDGETWTGTAGVGKGNLDITETTLFHGASTTKFNIAILMLLLEEEGLVDLDEPWTTYLSLDADFNPAITIRQLLNHTSGIADYLETSSTGALITSSFHAFYTPQHILENIVNDTPVFNPGFGFRYSNSNYALAALIAEAATGNPVQTELRNRIWEPLGMNHTYFGAYDTYTEPTAGVWWNFGDGNGEVDYSDMPTTSMLSLAYGSGNIVSCPTDLAILLNAIVNQQLLSPSSYSQMMTFVPGSYVSWTEGYVLGIHHFDGDQGDIVIGHDGYYSNLTDMFHSMNYGFTLVTMSNTESVWFAIYNSMYDILSDYFMTSDVSEFENNPNLTIYPNPTNHQFNISSSQMIDEVEITDVLGKVIYHAKKQEKDISLEIDTNGLYFITITSNEQITTRKLMVKN